MKKYYAFQVIALRFQLVSVTSKKVGLFKEFDEDSYQTNFYVIIIKFKEFKMVSDGNKIGGVEFF